MTKKKAILIGDYTKASYHPLKDIDQEIYDILKEDMTVLCTEDYDMLCAENLNKFDICISYVDFGKDMISKEQTAGLLSFVSNGGGLFIIHNGIALQSKYELAQMFGAKFTGHPPSKMLNFEVSAPEHIIMKGLSGFDMEEEPYQFEFDNFTEKTVLLEYRHEDKLCEAAWALEFGLGRVVYLMPGHNTHSFSNSIYREIILRSGKWASKTIN